MKIIITESQYINLKKELDEDYPTSWDIETFKNLKSYKARINYCNQNLQRISSGSSRIVYRIDDEKVLKLAKNAKGLSQNEIEIEYGNYYDLQDIVAKVFDSDDNNLWVEMELARKVSPLQFKQIVGYSFDEFCAAIRYFDESRRPKNRFSTSKPDYYDEICDNDFMIDVLYYLGNYDVHFGDLCKLNTFGLVKRNGQDAIVIIDYGLSKDVWTSQYEKKPQNRYY